MPKHTIRVTQIVTYAIDVEADDLVAARHRVRDLIEELEELDLVEVDSGPFVLDGDDPLPEGALTVEVGRDATVYYTRSFTGTTLEELKERMHRDGLEDDGLTGVEPDWEEGSFSPFDEVEVYRVYDHTGALVYEREMGS
jgi:hypothetical protein